MNNNYYYQYYDNNIKMNNISYEQWIDENLNNLNYLNNMFIDICYKYNIKFSEKKYDKVIDDFNYYMYLCSNK
jgi:hypothetical protein